ncbi:MAG: alpha/beta hydrolase family protein [Limisphaerales bacterium]
MPAAALFLAALLAEGGLSSPPADRTAILVRMEQVMGAFPPAARRVPLELRTLHETDQGDYLRREVSFQSEPGSRITAWLLVPKSVLGRQRSAPAVLGLHQTHPAGRRVVVGLGDSPDDEYGVELARRGFVSLAPPYPLLGDYAPDLKSLGYASGTMKAVWDNSRALDLLAALPFVSTNRGFGAIGHSLGGHNALFTAAFDERLTAVVTSCGFDSFRDYHDGDPAVWAPGRGWTSERYMPRLAAYLRRLDEIPFDFTDVLSAIAPRAVFVSAPMGDTNFRWRSAARVTAAVRPDFNAATLVVEHPDCGHRFPPEARVRAYEFLERRLK